MIDDEGDEKLVRTRTNLQYVLRRQTVRKATRPNDKVLFSDGLHAPLVSKHETSIVQTVIWTRGFIMGGATIGFPKHCFLLPHTIIK